MTNDLGRRAAVPPTRATAERVVERWVAMRWFVGIGTFFVVAGGLIAAVTRPTGFAEGPWVAAYFVLVGGVAQIALGGGQELLCDPPPSTPTRQRESALWNVGLVIVVAGSLSEVPLVSTIGGIVTALALILFLTTVRGAGPAGSRLAIAYQALVAVVLVSIPIGLVLAWIRHT